MQRMGENNLEVEELQHSSTYEAKSSRLSATHQKGYNPLSPVPIWFKHLHLDICRSSLSSSVSAQWWNWLTQAYRLLRKLEAISCTDSKTPSLKQNVVLFCFFYFQLMFHLTQSVFTTAWGIPLARLQRERERKIVHQREETHLLYQH